MLYYVILCYTMLYYTMLHYAILCYTMLYYVILYWYYILCTHCQYFLGWVGFRRVWFLALNPCSPPHETFNMLITWILTTSFEYFEYWWRPPLFGSAPLKKIGGKSGSYKKTISYFCIYLKPKTIKLGRVAVSFFWQLEGQWEAGVHADISESLGGCLDSCQRISAGDSYR